MTNTGTDTGMTVAPSALTGMGAGLRGDGSRVAGLAVSLDDDARMIGARTYGELRHVAMLWREELRTEGRLLDDLGANADDVGIAVERGDAANRSGFEVAR